MANNQSFSRLQVSDPDINRAINDLYDKLAQVQLALSKQSQPVGTPSTTTPATTSSDKPIVLFAQSNSNYLLTNTPTALPGTQIAIPTSGIYLITGNFSYQEAGAGDVGVLVAGYLFALGMTNSIAVQETMGVLAAAGTMTQQWIVSIPNVQSISLMVAKGGGAGTSICPTGLTTITALRIGPIS